jgi:four helix bundle protein
MEKKFLELNNISAYKIAFNISNYVWDIVNEWDYFSKKTIGGQFIRAIDSISANIAEGFGRYTKKDKISFYRYSYGSLKESLDWNEKAKMRKLLKEKEYTYILTELKRLPKEINTLIKFTNQRLTI